MIMKTLKENLQFILHPRFDSHIWKTRPDLRKYYLKDLVKDPELLGKKHAEIEFMFGPDESSKRLSERWMYSVGRIDNRKYYLVFAFNEDQTADVYYTYKNIYKMGYSR